MLNRPTLKKQSPLKECLVCHTLFSPPPGRRFNHCTLMCWRVTYLEDRKEEIRLMEYRLQKAKLDFERTRERFAGYSAQDLLKRASCAA